MSPVLPSHGVVPELQELDPILAAKIRDGTPSD